MFRRPAEDLSGVLRGIEHTIQGINLPEGVRVKIRGSVQAMRTSFTQPSVLG